MDNIQTINDSTNENEESTTFEPITSGDVTSETLVTSSEKIPQQVPDLGEGLPILVEEEEEMVEIDPMQVCRLFYQN